MLSGAKTAIVQGFDWAVKEGPLCEEPVRGIQLRLLDASLAATPLERSLGQLMPASRRAAYSAFLMAEPRLMEPMMEVEVIAPLDVAPAVSKVLKRRRGHIIADAPKPGTPFFIVRGYVPVMDSFGLETDLRVHTSGQAMVLQTFHHWDIVPGDPLDASIELRPLEPQPTSALAREFMVKTRRRKGLSEDVTVQRFFDEALLVELARHQATVEDAETRAEEEEQAAAAAAATSATGASSSSSGAGGYGYGYGSRHGYGNGRD
jgi:U5 small nuclear ribonucleoprotein component